MNTRKSRRVRLMITITSTRQTKSLAMKLFSLEAPCLLLFLFLLPTTIADLRSDKNALLQFAASVPHGRPLNWRNRSSVCRSWVGVRCTSDGSRVLSLRLPGVGLSGPIPANTLGQLDGLTILSLRSNSLSGNLPSDILSLPSLSYIYLQQNSFSGEIPSSLSPGLTSIDLSFNSLTGNIPTSIQNLTNLTKLSLQNNSLSGFVPDLSFSRLDQLNLSNNNLNGSIPASLRKFPASSFEGNSMLCGPPLNQCLSIAPSPSPSPSPTPVLQPSPSPKPVSAPSNPINLPPSQTFPPRHEEKKKLSTGGIVAIAAASSAVLFGLVLMLLVCCVKKKQREGGAVRKSTAFAGGRTDKSNEDFGSGVQEAQKNKLVFFDGMSHNFDLEDLLRASAEVLGKGSFGTTYRAILGEGTTVVVKRLKEVVVGKRGFEQQMEIIGKVGKHSNVVPLRAYYYSKDEKLLIYDGATIGSLSSVLHGNRGSGRTLDWDSRVRISLGTAKGLVHIHSASGGKLTHGDIKSSNVLLTQDLHGCISDFGLIPIMGFPTLPSRTTGYHAPEVMETKRVTHKSDVYSFGILLLEMLTGKAPVQSAGQDEAVDLPRWVQSVVREEWTAEVFDVELLKYQNVEEEMVQMLQIAMTCVAKTPEMRPTVAQVIKMIEEIRPSDSDNRHSSEDNYSKSPTSQTLTPSKSPTSQTP